MCGITGILHPSKPVREAFTKEALKLQSHRGPDNTESWTDDSIITVGHNRLSIIDLSDAGNQPMTSSNGRFTMVFNGEIYNHLEIREKHFKAHDFKSSSDSETILELFAKKGEAAFSEMLGMWSLLIWDADLQQLTISRDRFGQKPLYYARLDQGWAFSSEIKPLLIILKNVEPNYTMLTEYLSTGNYQHLGKETFFGEVEQLLPSQYASIATDSTSVEAKNYWKLPTLSESKGKYADQQYLLELKEIIEAAVISQTLSDVPIGITLSGGIDSSVIAGILGKYYTQPIHVFTAQTPGTKWDESIYVKSVMDRINSPNFKLHSVDLNELMSLDDLDKLLEIQEEPFGDPSIMAHHQLMEIASKNNIKVVLGGQGADELFWGYGHSVNAILAHCVRHWKFKTVFTWLRKGNLSKSLWLRIVLAGIFPSLEARLRKQSREKRKQNVPESIKTKSRNLPTQILTNINQSWHDSILGIHIPHLVHYDDRNGMSVSVEGRMPFFDHRIIEKLGELKPSEFVKGGKRKNILRLACAEYLPEEVLNRTDKVGFFTPLLNIIKSWKLQETDVSANIKQLDLQLQSAPNVNNALWLFRSLSIERWRNRYLGKHSH